VPAVLVGGALLAIGVDELSGDAARDRWTVARIVAGAAVIALGLSAQHQATRPTVRRLLATLAVTGVLVGCAGFTGMHARRAFALAFGSASYLAVKGHRSVGAAALAFVFLCQALSGHVAPADRLATAIFAPTLLALAVGAYRWPGRVRQLAGGCLAAALVWAALDGHWWSSSMAPAEDAVATFAGLLWVDSLRTDRAKRRAASPDPQ
jgi:hypothetical protein